MLLIAAKSREKRHADMVTSAYDVRVQIVDPLEWQPVENIHWTTRPIRFDIYDCSRRCLKKKREDQMRSSARKLERLLARTLEQTELVATLPAGNSNPTINSQPQDIHPPSIIALTLQGFSTAEAHYLEQRLVRFSDNADISLRSDDGSRRQYWYEADIPSWELEKRLSNDLARMGLVARLIENEDDGAITVIRQQREIAYFSNE